VIAARVIPEFSATAILISIIGIFVAVTVIATRFRGGHMPGAAQL
jgi:hypothetical protein